MNMNGHGGAAAHGQHGRASKQRPNSKHAHNLARALSLAGLVAARCMFARPFAFSCLFMSAWVSAVQRCINPLATSATQYTQPPQVVSCSIPHPSTHDAHQKLSNAFQTCRMAHAGHATSHSRPPPRTRSTATGYRRLRQRRRRPASSCDRGQGAIHGRCTYTCTQALSEKSRHKQRKEH
jgi:hypothetical protein